ncbi:MAG: hypothetical protein ABI549_12460 [Flavobacterium sp.]|uniref:hypothetical protein n=1 Tax=Flavobacterium sp. TaxID=239 RepID=UPI0032660BB7
MRKIFYSIILLFTVYSYAEKQYLLEGTVGKATIYMFFEDNSSPTETAIYDVRYFYKNSLKDIVLSGEKTGNKYVFKFESNDKINETFELSLTQNDNFNGFWTDAKGLKLPVSFKPFDKSGFLLKEKNNPFLKQFKEDSFDFIKASFIQFKSDSISIYKGKTIEWFSEKHCNAPYFRLGKGFSDAVKNKINPILNKYHYQNILAQLNCSSSFDYNNGNGIEYSISIHYLDENLIGYYDFSSYYCGGAHPDFGGQGILLDLKSGKSYGIDDILAFDKSVGANQETNFDAFSKYRSNYFASKIFALVNKTQHFKKPTNDDDYCDYTDLEFWDFPSWSFTEKGIEFTPIFYRAARSCEEPFLVSFSDLRKFKNTKFPYKL